MRCITQKGALAKIAQEEQCCKNVVNDSTRQRPALSASNGTMVGKMNQMILIPETIGSNLVCDVFHENIMVPPEKYC
jgi:hypothetical protein